jgi:CHAD domain-containing protein
VASYGRRLDCLTPEQLHELRIACKRFRYTAEFFGPIYRGGLTVVTRPMVRMQDLLGEVHDMDVWSDRIGQWWARKRRPAGTADRRSLRALLQHLDERKAACLTEAQQAWQDFTRSGTRKDVSKQIASPRRA